MAKISQVSAKYIVNASIDIEGVVDRPDVIGAIFGQTEGLLGADLELRELQRSGRIGRIEVDVDTRNGKTNGKIIIPSSLDKAETAIVGAALEIIQRIGPCNAKIHVDNIEDVRISKRQFVIARAKELLKQLMDKVMPDSQEIADEVAYSVRVMEITTYGKDRLPAGPMVEDSDEIIVVEGRADVINMLKHGFKNAVAVNGTNIPESVLDLCRKKEVTIFVDGDRGGDLIVKELTTQVEIEFVARAPDGKEVEELTKKEIHMAIRARISAEQAKLDFDGKTEAKAQQHNHRYQQQQTQSQQSRPAPVQSQSRSQPPVRQQSSSATSSSASASSPVSSGGVKKVLTTTEKNAFKNMLEDLIGTRGAYLIDEKQNILGKVPITELATTVKSLGSGIYAIILDGLIEKALVLVAESANVSFMIGMDSKVTQKDTKINLLTVDDLE